MQVSGKETAGTATPFCRKDDDTRKAQRDSPVPSESKPGKKTTVAKRRSGPKRTRSSARSRPLELLVGIRAITAFLHVSNRKMPQLLQEKAPISRDEAGVLRAEKTELWEWWKKRCREEHFAAEKAHADTHP